MALAVLLLRRSGAAPQPGDARQRAAFAARFGDGSRLSIHGEPALEANALTHIVAEGRDVMQRLAPSLARRHHPSQPDGPPPKRARTAPPTRFVTPDWLAASLAAGQPQPAERYAMPAVAPEAVAPTGRQAELAPAAAAAAQAAAPAGAPRTFDGRTILHNLLPGERPSAGHVTVRDLTPAGCVAALATTMYPHGANGTGAIEWLQNNCPVDNMMIITNGLRDTGEQLRVRDYFDEEDKGWIVRHVKPKGASGSKLLHAGLMLFRTKRILRVVIFGGNLNMQPDLDRDGLWAQDFRLLPHDTGDEWGGAASRNRDSRARFGQRLRRFVDYINPPPLAAQDRPTPNALWRRIERHVEGLFRGVDFSTAAASLVESMPGAEQGDDRGGWRRLQHAVTEQRGRRMSMADPFYVSSGHYPDGPTHHFVATIAAIMRNSELPSAPPPADDGKGVQDEDKGWELVDPGACALLMPSKATVLQANPLALLRCTGVHAPAWEKMGEVGRARFHDGRPEFERVDPKAVAPLSHGKVMAAFTADKEHCTCCKIVMLSRSISLSVSLTQNASSSQTSAAITSQRTRGADRAR